MVGRESHRQASKWVGARSGGRRESKVCKNIARSPSSLAMPWPISSSIAQHSTAVSQTALSWPALLFSSGQRGVSKQATRWGAAWLTSSRTETSPGPTTDASTQLWPCENRADPSARSSTPTSHASGLSWLASLLSPRGPIVAGSTTGSGWGRCCGSPLTTSHPTRNTCRRCSSCKSWCATLRSDQKQSGVILLAERIRVSTSQRSRTHCCFALPYLCMRRVEMRECSIVDSTCCVVPFCTLYVQRGSAGCR
jgi:hypothetical protein